MPSFCAAHAMAATRAPRLPSVRDTLTLRSFVDARGRTRERRACRSEVRADSCGIRTLRRLSLPSSVPFYRAHRGSAKFSPVAWKF